MTLQMAAYELGNALLECGLSSHTGFSNVEVQI